MLKTTEQQQTSPDEYGAERLAPVESAQATQITAGELVEEPESLENIQALINEFSIDRKRRQRKWWTVWGVMVGSIVPFACLTFFALSRVVHSGHWWFVAAALALQFLSPFLCCAYFMSLARPSKRQQEIIDIVVASNDVRAISPLLAGGGAKSKVTRDLVIAALTKLLPRLKEGDIAWLSDHDQRCLFSALKYANSGLKYSNSGLIRKYYGDRWAEYIVASLHALGEVGDNRALLPVEALATGAASTDDEKRIQQAAIDCLIPLRKRVERDRVGEHLLRSSDTPEGESDMLLIPAVENVEADARELPRASELK